MNGHCSKRSNVVISVLHSSSILAPSQILVHLHRGIDGVQVIYWYHRQFLEAAEARYLGDARMRHMCHMAIAEYFLGMWAGLIKLYVYKITQESNIT